MTMVAIKQI